MVTTGVTETAVEAGKQDGLPMPRRTVAIVALSLGTVLTTIDGSIISVALPTLARDLRVEPSSAVMVVTVYQLVMMMAMLPFAALGERIGLRRLYQYGQVVFLCATVLCFFAQSLPFLVIVRIFQALGAAATLAVGSALIRSIYPAAILGRGLSLNTVIAATASSFAPTVGGLILSMARWPWLFGVLVPFGVLSVIIGRRSLPDPVARDEPYDTLGAVLCAATFGLGIFGLESAVHGDSPVVSAALVALAIGMGVVFVRREGGQARPTFPIDLMRYRVISLSSISLLLGYMASMLLTLMLPFRLQQQYGFTPAEAGAAIAVWPLMSMVLAPTSGLLSDRLPAGLLGGIGMIFAMAGLGSLAWLPEAPTYLDLVWRVLLCGAGFGIFYSPGTRQVVGAAPMDRAAAAGGLTSTVRGAGQTLGSTLVAALLASGAGVGPTGPLIAVGLAFMAGICSFSVLGAHVRRQRIEDLPDL
ncbi:MFS transporter [Sphingobium sufflavum]|uniref:MFS transporter n=1 Tax=Sphingobium sufflavum TaxID=1129547 RepID=UPI001F415732|nr:MFS transporter [Sphingobium sufflavum]MCE7795749.1 MFS transporter [Sphingobium sufflavum]